MSAPTELYRIAFRDAPPHYPVPVRCISWMVDAPGRLRVALHLHAVGVYQILGDGETRQERLWRVVEYVRDGWTDRGEVAYRYDAATATPSGEAPSPRKGSQ